jgi:hypothetical protein
MAASFIEIPFASTHGLAMACDGNSCYQLRGRIRRQLIESPRMRLMALAVLVGCGGGDRAPVEDSGTNDDGKADDGIDPDAMAVALPMPNGASTTSSAVPTRRRMESRSCRAIAPHPRRPASTTSAT